jgi:hypothetical protein
VSTEIKDPAMSELFKKVFGPNERLQDPDKGNVEWDIWLQSGCGRSSETITVPDKKLEGKHDLGVWTGKVCAVLCLKVYACRTGSMDIQKTPVDPSLNVVMPGQKLMLEGKDLR